MPTGKQFGWRADSKNNTRPSCGRALPTLAAIILAAVCLNSLPAWADIDAEDLWENDYIEGGPIFPNYYRVLAEDAMVQLAPGTTGTERINGITVVNYGTAHNADFKGIYVYMACGALNSGYLSLTYAGTYAEDAGNFPAWTWAGSSPDFSTCADLCACLPECCGGGFSIQIYADIAACPTDQATINLGFPYHELTNTSWGGSVSDNNGNFVPWDDVHPENDFTICYAWKEGPSNAAPGDTVDFTLYYGRPGTSALSAIMIYDSIPAYMHYIPNSAVPAADPFYNPSFGVPQILRWTVTGPLAVTGGITNMITFQMSVDWGNGNAFEPGSGDTAAPEGIRLPNRADIFFNGMTGCSVNPYTTAPVTTVVKRFLFWMLGDNDLLLAAAPGQPADEMTYTTFIANVSDTKTWWDVAIWDTVPSQINSWCANCGFYDPCTGWTMTPSGCAGASPGYRVNGVNTILTWRLDMPPRATISLQWKGQIKGSANPGDTAINLISVFENGRTRIVDGTGASGKPALFVHVAPILLRTTYISYVGFMAGSTDGATCPGYYLDFFPLNKQAQFALYGIQYQGLVGFSNDGGISQSIGCPVGDCITGFPGNAGCTLGTTALAITGGGTPGCGASRIPAVYNPAGFIDICPTVPMTSIYKIVSNAPVLWQLLTHSTVLGTPIDNEDFVTMAPSTTLTYRGFMHYTWRGEVVGEQSLDIFNTGLDYNNNLDPNLTTSVFLFRFSNATNDWDFVAVYDLGPEGHASDVTQTAADYAAWRIMSSQAATLVEVGFQAYTSFPNCCCNVADNLTTFSATRENGYTVSTPGATGTFYGVINGLSCNSNQLIIVGNEGAATADFGLDIYVPDNTAGPANIPLPLRDTSGYWSPYANYSVPAGLATAGNPLVFHNSPFNGRASTAFRIRLISGGPIQVLHGVNSYEWWSGGSVIHSAGGTALGNQFWLNLSGMCPSTKGGPLDKTFGIEVFCSKKGMTVQMISEAGYSSRYTTTGPDQCVLFKALTTPADCVTVNYRIDVVGNSAISMFNADRITETGYTAPFLSSGVHYIIVMPPVVFVGQNFWITVIVMDQGSSVTKTDYSGTTSFTSTDPNAKIETKAMDTYNYTWNGCGTNCGVKIFFNVSFLQVGLQTIVATDTLDGSIAGVGTTLVVAADVKLEKKNRLTVAASGDTVRFQICWSNFSSASAFSFTITDAVPMGTSYVPEIASTMLCQASTPLPSFTVWYSTATSTTPPGTFTSVPGTSSPLSNTRWLRWTIRDVYVNSTGCVCYKVSVN